MVVDGGAADVDLGDVRVKEGHQLADGGDLEAGADDDDEVRLVAVVVDQAARELVWQRLAEEGDVGLHDAALGRHVVLGVTGAVIITRPPSRSAARAILGQLALAAVLGAAAGDAALGTPRDLAGLDVGQDVIAWDLVVAGEACGGCEGAVAMCSVSSLLDEMTIAS